MRVFAVRELLDHRCERQERAASLRGRTLIQIDAEPALHEVRHALEIGEALQIPRVVDARVGRVLRDEGVGGVDGRVRLARAVIRVDRPGATGGSAANG